MRLAILLVVVFSLTVVWAKTSGHKALTESLGQEVIELTAPVKELDEEPAAENGDDDPTTTTFQPATRNKKPALETRRRQKDEKETPKLDNDDEARIAKELAEIYKDNADYKDDRADEAAPETTRAATPAPAPAQDAPGKPAERQRPPSSFKFQPNDINNKKEVERFRTSVDDISCDKGNTKLTDETPEQNSTTQSAYSVWANLCLVVFGEIFVLSI